MISHSMGMLCLRLYFYTCASHSRNAHWFLTNVWFPYIESSSNYFKTVIINVFISCVPCKVSHSDWKTWKKGKLFSSQGILNRLEKSGKITQNTGKVGGSSGLPRFREKSGKAIFFFRSGNFGHLIPFFSVTLLGIRSYFHFQKWQKRNPDVFLIISNY